ncbi:MAG: N-acetylmuramoyl-L-alanine amidase, partial [Thermoleophilia bacterium]
PAAAGAAGYFFQRSHYYSEHGARLSGYIGAEIGRLSSAGFIGSLGRNFAVLREPTGIAVMIEPLFLSNPADAARAGRADYVERLARAVVAGFSRYLARA